MGMQYWYVEQRMLDGLPHGLAAWRMRSEVSRRGGIYRSPLELLSGGRALSAAGCVRCSFLEADTKADMKRQVKASEPVVTGRSWALGMGTGHSSASVDVNWDELMAGARGGGWG